MLSENLRKYRKIKNKGINELARLSGVNAGYISAIERGQRSNPSIEIIEKLADALEISASELLEDPKNESSNSEINLNPNDITNNDIRCIARAGQNMTSEQAKTLRKVAETLFPEAFKNE